MTRTAGSKNKPKSTEALIAELKSRGIAMPDNLLPAPAAPAPEKAPPKKPVESSGTAPAKGQTREKFVLTQNTPENKEAEQWTFRCGNKLCNKLLDSKRQECPYCGVNLNWPTE